jgi:hypothetical protein
VAAGDGGFQAPGVKLRFARLDLHTLARGARQAQVRFSEDALLADPTCRPRACVTYYVEAQVLPNLLAEPLEYNNFRRRASTAYGGLRWRSQYHICAADVASPRWQRWELPK